MHASRVTPVHRQTWRKNDIVVGRRAAVLAEVLKRSLWVFFRLIATRRKAADLLMKPRPLVCRVVSRRRTPVALGVAI
jgi:hypothetical protein